MHPLPQPRGSISDYLLGALVRPPHELAPISALPWRDPLSDEDLQLSLYLLYELHYRGLAHVDDRWEWSPSLLRIRATLEDVFERALLEAVPMEAAAPSAEEVQLELGTLAEQDGPPLSQYIKSQAGVAQVREFVIHRSAYQLKEADPHSWAIPRLFGPPKAALVEIQADEYGQGRPEWVHAELFARSMRALSLDSGYGAYLSVIPGVTLATVNLMSMLGLHRRWRAAIVGHLALFEMTSSIPNRRYGDGLRRLGFGPEATLFFDEHVLADAAHENVAAVDLAGGLVRQNRRTGPEVLWGARALSLLEERWAAHLLSSWRRDQSSLLELEPVLGPEADQLVGPIAEGLELGATAPAQSNGIPVAIDGSAVGPN